MYLYIKKYLHYFVIIMNIKKLKGYKLNILVNRPLIKRLIDNHNYLKPVSKNINITFKFDKSFKTIYEKLFLNEINLIF